MNEAREKPAAAPGRPKERIRGTVLRITFRNPENDYRVVKLLPESGANAAQLDKRGEIVLVGNLPGIEVGASVEAEGQWAQHARHGPQFKADWFKPELPSGKRGIIAYLSSGAIRGVGEVFAARIVEAFGEKTLEVMDADIGQLARVKGMNRKKLDRIRASWREAREDRDLVVFLGNHGIASSWAKRLKKAYGGAALSIVRANPYRLALEVHGIGFQRADAMAKNLGLPADSPERIEAALAHALETQAGEGHTFMPREALLETACELLGLDARLVEENLARLVEAERLARLPVGEFDAIFLPSLLEAERECAAHLKKLAATRRRTPQVDPAEFLAKFQDRARIVLAPAQRAAVEAIATGGMLIMTGGPGTGKTTTLRAVIELFKSAKRPFRLAAPTGRAARRLSEATHEPAETIHRLLAYQPHTGTFAHGPKNPLETALLVVDEVSMLDAPLARDLFSALTPGTCLLLVGDEDQLPSVGPGNVLGDAIASGIIPVTRLNEVFRQAEASLIVRNAHRVNQGHAPILAAPDDVADPDFFFIEKETPEEILETMRTLVAERIPRKFGLDPVADVQILTPMRRGELGVLQINRMLQEALNSAARGGAGGLIEGGDAEPRERERLVPGDRVLQTVNDYERDVLNGDVGRVARVDAESGEVIVDFEGRPVAYLADETRQLALAYAMTIHKSQGSEYPAVLIPLHMQHYVMLQRNLIYTAMTRARRLVCMIGQKRALWRAVKNVSQRRRNSALGHFLRDRGSDTAP